MRYRANAKILSKGGKELGRVSYTVKARNRADAKRKIGRLMKSRVHRRKNPRPKVSFDRSVKKYMATVYDPKYGNIFATGGNRQEALAALRKRVKEYRAKGGWR